jgi:rare lipoprotein A (peptidoglycan hydrolase)
MNTHGRLPSSGSLIALLTLAMWLSSPSSVVSTEAPPSAEDTAKKVKQQARRSEKKEGKHDLVRDTVRTKTTRQGAVVLEQQGEASFYGKGFHGKAMASGKKFDQHKLTAAHPTLPLGTKATVTNLETGQKVEVRITDRGPYAKGRDIDLSTRAAQAIGLTKKEGEMPVQIEAVISPSGTQTAPTGDPPETQGKPQGERSRVIKRRHCLFVLLCGVTIFETPTGRMQLDDRGPRTEEYVRPGGDRTIIGPQGKTTECHTTPTGERCERLWGAPTPLIPPPSACKGTGCQ